MTRRYARPVLVTLVIFAGLNAAASPAFTDSGNCKGMLIGAAPFIITAVAQTATVMSGGSGIDLSAGPLAGLVNAFIVSVLVPYGWIEFPLSGHLACWLRVGPFARNPGGGCPRAANHRDGWNLSRLPEHYARDVADGRGPGAPRARRRIGWLGLPTAEAASLECSSCLSRWGSRGSRSNGPRSGAICWRSAGTREQPMRRGSMSPRCASSPM